MHHKKTFRQSPKQQETRSTTNVNSLYNDMYFMAIIIIIINSRKLIYAMVILVVIQIESNLNVYINIKKLSNKTSTSHSLEQE